MKIAPLAELKDRLSAYIDAAKDSAIVVTRNGKPVALLTSILEDDDLDSLLLTHDRKFVRLLAEARERVRAGRYLTNEQFWRELRRRRTRRGNRSSSRGLERTARR
jgi:prevent-host-death family protein